MIRIDLNLHAYSLPLVLAGSFIFGSATALADAPQPEAVSKPAELILTLSDDLPQTENSHLSSHALKPPNDSRFINNHDKKSPLDMNCGVDANPYPEMGNSITSRLAGACDLKYSY